MQFLVYSLSFHPKIVLFLFSSWPLAIYAMNCYVWDNRARIKVNAPPGVLSIYQAHAQRSAYTHTYKIGSDCLLPSFFFDSPQLKHNELSRFTLTLIKLYSLLCKTRHIRCVCAYTKPAVRLPVRKRSIILSVLLILIENSGKYWCECPVPNAHNKLNWRHWFSAAQNRTQFNWTQIQLAKLPCDGN